jgi:CheY-like chemotaxis protein
MLHPTAEVLLVEDSLTIVDWLSKRSSSRILRYPSPSPMMGLRRWTAFWHGFLRQSSTSYPHLILIDLNLPKISGREVLRVLRAYARTRAIPAIVISGTPEERAIADSYELGANSYLMKPTSQVQFREAVQQMAAY